MSRLYKGQFIVERERPGQCELCGAVAELRPYGPNRERICFDCGEKDCATTEARFREILDAAHVVVDNRAGRADG